MIMKKKMTMIMLAILCFSVSSLQAGIRIGVKAGVNLAQPAFNTDAIKTENFTGFQAGPVIEISGLSGLGVEAAILYSQQGMKIKGLSLEERISTLDVPVNLKLNFSLANMVGCYLTAGPYVSFKLDEQTTNLKNTYDKVLENWEGKDFGVGLNFGAGVKLLSNLQVGVNYQLGLNDDFKNYKFDLEGVSSVLDANAKTRIWSITATYFF